MARTPIEAGLTKCDYSIKTLKRGVIHRTCRVSQTDLAMLGGVCPISQLPLCAELYASGELNRPEQPLPHQQAEE